MSLWDLFRGRKGDDEAVRRDRLLRSGRIADARICDIKTDTTGTVTHVFYIYNVGGTDYESSHALSDEQRDRPHDYMPGLPVIVRFDPRQPGNSIVV